MPSADHLGLNEPALQWQFYAVFAKVPGIHLWVATASLPSISWEQTEVQYFVGTRKLASRATVNETSITVRDYVDPDTASMCYKWYRLVGDPIGGTLNPPKEYKSEGALIVTNGRGDPVNTWSLKGCWPSSMEFGDADYSGTDLIQINITVQIDTVELM